MQRNPRSYTRTQGKRLYQILRARAGYKRRKTLRSRRKGDCVLVTTSKIKNPFKDKGKKPDNLTPRQIIWIHRTGSLPDNSAVTDTRYLIEISHLCGNAKCINKKHLVLEKRYLNLLRDICHALCVKRHKAAVAQFRLKRKDKSVRSVRFTSVAELQCIALSSPDCKCSPSCFKNFDLSEINL